MKFGTWNVGSLYRAGSLTAAVRELARYKLDFVSVQEFRWDKEGREKAKDFYFFYRKLNENYQLEIGFFVHYRIVSAVKRAEFVSDRMSCKVLRCRWCNIINLNVPAPNEDRSDDSKLSFCKDLEQGFFNPFSKYSTKILRDFNAKVGRENIFKPTIGNESLHHDSNHNGVTVFYAKT
jgi:exonuclease III